MLVEQPPRPNDGTDAREGPRRAYTQADLASLKLALTGESAVDMPRLFFSDRAAVDAFLRLLEFDTDNPMDLNHLSELHHEAVQYLADVHRYRLPQRVEQPEAIHDLFLAAANGAPRLRRHACVTLKVMHIIHHLQAREMVFNSSISEAELADRLNTKVFNTIDRMRASGVQVTEFAAGKKSRESLVTKLLAKRHTWASAIFDKVRFRVVVQGRDDLVPAVVYLLRHLVPFNYTIPEQSQNNLLTAEDIGRVLNLPIDLLSERWGDGDLPFSKSTNAQNEFSGPTYRCVSFVADIPLRIDDAVATEPPAVAFVQAEIQLVDAATNDANNQGENDHDLYKKRQHERVQARLERASDDNGGEEEPD
jgi:uncharacterized protein (TIGR04552 family)